jgi:hypothetical protein
MQIDRIEECYFRGLSAKDASEELKLPYELVLDTYTDLDDVPEYVNLYDEENESVS